MASLNGCYAKLDRAKQHFRQFEAVVGRGFANGRYGLSPDEDENGDLVYRVLLPESEAIKLGVRIGDVVHNLRSVLDHMVWQLVLANGKCPGRWNQFPVVSEEKRFPPMSGGKSWIEGVSDNTFTFIEGTQPYIRSDNDWEHPLSNLIKLSNTDKHRLIVPVGQGIRVRSASYRDEIFNTPFGVVVSSFVPGDSTSAGIGPLEHDAEAFRITSAERAMDMEYSITQAIAFKEGRGLKGRYVSVVLTKMIDEVRSILGGAKSLIGA